MKMPINWRQMTPPTTVKTHKERDIEKGDSFSEPQEERQSEKHEDIQENSCSSSSNGSENMQLTADDMSHGHYRRTCRIMALVLLIGACACATILALGVQSAQDEQRGRFEQQAGDLLEQLVRAFDDYTVAGLWIHQACRSRSITHADFRVLYEHLLASGLEYQMVAFAMNVTLQERPMLEAASRNYSQENYPDFNYTGFRQFYKDSEGKNSFGAVPDDKPYYYPIHFVEPLDERTSQNTFDFDIAFDISGALDVATTQALQTGRIVVTRRRPLGNTPYYHVRMFHPGIQSSDPHYVSRDVAMVTVRIPALIERAAHSFHIQAPLRLYIFDNTDESLGEPPLFMGSGLFQPGNSSPTIDDVDTELEEVLKLPNSYKSEGLVYEWGTRKYTFIVTAPTDAFSTDLTFVIFGAVMIFVACAGLALWIFTNERRDVKLSQMRANMILDSAKKMTQAERELNDFIAHEVRNPLSAAMSACSFVSSAVNEKEPLTTPESQLSVREDTTIIQSSLKFINDLLRTMLDMNRASSRQMQLELSKVDILKDVLEPVATMLYRRGQDYDVITDGPAGLIIESDRVRLKQIVMNLARNSSKFVSKGFVRIRGAVVEGSVVIFVEDSGPGIPFEKVNNLFTKYQQSLDSLSQGTGIGLYLCKALTELLGGEIVLDRSYHSGIQDCPGARFLINLRTPPLSLNAMSESSYRLPSVHETDETKSSDGSTTRNDDAGILPQQMPEKLSVLIVDDDAIIRKLFTRSVGRVAPDWQVQEASNGETALLLVERNTYDLIFMDQYMASAEQQLLGTETVRELRGKGNNSIICGLSANDMEKQFLDVGAEAFMIKPFPCEKVAFQKELFRVLSSSRMTGRSEPAVLAGKAQ